MGYRFPGKRISSRDVPDPTLIRKQILPAAEEYAGKLNEHNIVSGTFASSRASTALLYDHHYALVDADPHIHSNASHLPDGLDADAFLVSDSAEWQTPTGMSVSYAEGAHEVWVTGWLQYWIVPTGTNFDDSATPATKPRIQVAVRVNGSIIEETITGTRRPDEGAPRGVRPQKAVEDGTDPHKMHSLDYVNARSTGSMAWQVKFVRVQCQVAVPQGTTTVELVVRRVIPDGTTNYGGVPPSLYVGNRIINATVLKLGGADSGGGQTVGIDYPEDGDKISATTLGTNILTAFTDAANSLSADAIQRYGLRKEHLPQQQVQAGYTDQCLAGTNTARTYPGWGNAGVVGVGNWDQVSDGLGNYLEVTLNDGSGTGWDFSTRPGFVVVYANIAFTKAAGASLVATGPVLSRYGVFGLGLLHTSGATALDQAMQGWVNNPNVRGNWIAGAGAGYASDECCTDVPLFGYFDWRAAPPAGGKVQKIRVLVSCDNTTQVDWERSSLYVIIYRP